jgi:hypothetical protein
MVDDHMLKKMDDMGLNRQDYQSLRDIAVNRELCIMRSLFEDKYKIKASFNGSTTPAHKDPGILTTMPELQYWKDGVPIDMPAEGGLFIRGPNNQEIRIELGEGDLSI